MLAAARLMVEAILDEINAMLRRKEEARISHRSKRTGGRPGAATPQPSSRTAGLHFGGPNSFGKIVVVASFTAFSPAGFAMLHTSSIATSACGSSTARQ